MELSISDNNNRNLLFPEFKAQSGFLFHENSLLIEKELIFDEGTSDTRPSNSSQIKPANYLEEILNTITIKLKTQLSNISLASELLGTSLLSSEQQMFVEIIQRGSESLRDLIADIKLTTFKYGLQSESLSQTPFSNY